MPAAIKAERQWKPQKLFSERIKFGGQQTRPISHLQKWFGQFLNKNYLKEKNNNLDELRNNVLDIWAKFPQELCEKITNEFDEKIRICQKEEEKY